MEKLNFSIHINAPRIKVWNVLLGERTYPEWTSVFAPDSQVETDWKEGSKALFLDGRGNGMVSKIARNIPNEHISINHLGIVKDGKEDTESEEVKKWAGAQENYTLVEKDGGTELRIHMDSDEEYRDYFSKTWPQALEKVKKLSESR
jgi:uncharacterized protein YndB with AHSA1/START domain